MGAADGLIEVLCQWGSLYAGYIIGDKLGIELGFLLTKHERELDQSKEVIK